MEDQEGDDKRTGDCAGDKTLFGTTAEGMFITKAHKVRRNGNEAAEWYGEDQLAQCVWHPADSFAATVPVNCRRDCDAHGPGAAQIVDMNCSS